MRPHSGHWLQPRSQLWCRTSSFHWAAGKPSARSFWCLRWTWNPSQESRRLKKSPLFSQILIQKCIRSKVNMGHFEVETKARGKGSSKSQKFKLGHCPLQASDKTGGCGAAYKWCQRWNTLTLKRVIRRTWTLSGAQDERIKLYGSEDLGSAGHIWELQALRDSVRKYFCSV